MIENSVNLENVSFCYPNTSKLVLDDISCTFEKGKKYAIVGSSGSGKSTLLKILQKHYTDYSGKIELDGVDLLDISFETFNREVAFIQPDVFMFNDSIKNNIILFDEVYDEHLLDQSIRESQLNQVISKSENDIDTIVGEKGELLSSGEKQRISLARALYADCSLLLLDEATSALDNITSFEIEKSIISSNKTVIMVTHKLDNVILDQVDEIIVLDEGKIAERGSFRQLMEGNSKLKSLVKVAS